MRGGHLNPKGPWAPQGSFLLEGPMYHNGNITGGDHSKSMHTWRASCRCAMQALSLVPILGRRTTGGTQRSQKQWQRSLYQAQEGLHEAL